MKFGVYQQRTPIKVGNDEWAANLVAVDVVEAATPAEAIALASRLPVFRRAQNLAKYPIVGESA